MLKRLMFLIVFFCLAAPAGVGAEEGLTEERLEDVAEVYVEVMNMEEEYQDKIESARNEGNINKVNTLQREINDKSFEIVEESDVDRDEYNQIMDQARHDEEVADALLDKVDELQ